MNKKQQKWIALLVTLTFVWLLQVSVMPLAAASTTEQLSSANAENAPNFVEQVGSAGYHAKKKSILPVILIGVGVAAVAAVLILVVFKTKYDIVGSWTFVWTPNVGSQTYTFTGTKSSGNFVCPGYPDNTGTYTVDGKDAVFVITTRTGVQFTGKFTGKDTMTGAWVEGGGTWTFAATRVGTTAAVKPASTGQAIKMGPGR